MRKGLRVTTRILLGILAAVFGLAVQGVFFLMICDAAVVHSARAVPSYEKTDLSELLLKESWTEEDYDVLFHQTGLGKSALDGMKDDPARILTFQEALFYEGEITQEQIAFTTKHDRMKGFTAPLADLQDGDVLVTSSCHTFGWRNGHAAIVTNAARKTVLESYSLGEPSTFGGVTWFKNASNFLVLRLKDASAEERAEIAAWARERLLNVDYSVLVGISYPKDQGDYPSRTHCSHLVWQAFYQFGYDIDSDGGPVVTSRDIANSPYFEVVQVYGFDPDRLWT